MRKDEPPYKPRPFNWGRKVKFEALSATQLTSNEPTWDSEAPISDEPASDEPASNEPTSDESENTTSFNSVTPIALLAMSLAALIGTSYWYFKKSPSSSSRQPTPLTSGSSINSHQSLSIPESNLFDIPPLTVARNFAFSSDIEERLKWSRNPEKIRQRLQEYPEDACTTPAEQITHQGDVQVKGLHYTNYLAVLPDGTRRLLCVVGTKDGPRIDWDAYARYGTAIWEEIFSGETSKATVRIFPIPSDYYTKRYHDRDEWAVYALISPDLEIPLHGYVKKNTPLHSEFLETEKAVALRAIVDINIDPQDIIYRQVEITNLRILGWVEKEVP